MIQKIISYIKLEGTGEDGCKVQPGIDKSHASEQLPVEQLGLAMSSLTWVSSFETSGW